jgi:hypothetical protein
MLKKKTVAFAVEHPFEHIAFKVLLALLAFLIFSYLYFVAASIMNVVARREALAQSSRIESSIGDLEQKYFSLSQQVTPEEGVRLGLVPLTQPTYVNRPGNVGQAITSQGAI